MKKANTNILLTGIFLCLLININAQFTWDGYDLVAHYPLTENGNEMTSKTDPMYMEHISFDQGAAYSNGIYNGSFEDGCIIQTPSFTSMNLSRFGISLEVKVDTVYNKELPVLLVGEFNRYLGLYFDMSDDGSFRPYMFKNYGGVRLKADTLLSVDTWYKFDLTHNNDTTRIYLNNKMILEHIEAFDFYGQEEDASTKKITNNNAGDGVAFRGFWKNFKVYSDDLAGSNGLSIEDNEIQLFPNPCIDILKISSKSAIKSLDIYDQLGKQFSLSNPIESNQKEIDIDIRHFSLGIYTIKITYSNHTFSNSRFMKL